MSWILKLQSRWGLKNTQQVFVILLVFACTGTTIYLLKKPILAYFSTDGQVPIAFSIAYWIVIFPIYNAFLLLYGFIFGQFSFFWEFEKKTFRRLRRKKDATATK